MFEVHLSSIIPVFCRSSKPGILANPIMPSWHALEKTRGYDLQRIRIMDRKEVAEGPIRGMGQRWHTLICRWSHILYISP